MKKNEIHMKGETDFKDNELREAFSRMGERITTLNDRTKSHTLKIRGLEKRLKKLEVEDGKRLQT